MRVYTSHQHHNNHHRDHHHNHKQNAKLPKQTTSLLTPQPRQCYMYCCNSTSSSNWSMMPIKLFTFMLFVTLFSLHATAVHAQVADDGVAVAGAAAADSVAKGLKTRMRSPKIAQIHVLQAVPESLPNHEITAEFENKTEKPAGKFEIRSVSGEPNYKSVNLTWEVEFVPSPQDIITNSSDEIEPPTAFQLFFCELQSFGPHRCRSKVVNGSKSTYDNSDDNNLEVIDNIRQLRQYAAQVDNLRMATKYSFHVRSVPKRKQLKKITGRSEIFDNEVEGNDFLSTNNLGGQTIVIPTKGFSAQATRCLPNASEIEVETGPYFGGKIVVDGGSCGIKGDPNDTKDKYVMRIDHKACGSMVKQETNTVETFITVQENLGIFTHSTRRFVVVCSYQSGLQTVRASFSVPGRGGAVAQHDSAEEDERMGRGLRPFRFVDKSELILKEATEDETETQSSEETQALVQEMENPTVGYNQSEITGKIDDVIDDSNDVVVAAAAEDDDVDTSNAVAILENIIPGLNEDHIKMEVHQTFDEEKSDEMQLIESAEKDADDEQRFSAKFAKLILERNDHNDDNSDETLENYGTMPTGRAFGSALELISVNMGSVLLTVLLSVILIGIFLYILYRETRKPLPMTPAATAATATLPRHQQLKETHTLPRTLRSKHQDMLA